MSEWLTIAAIAALVYWLFFVPPGVFTGPWR